MSSRQTLKLLLFPRQPCILIADALPDFTC